MNVIWNVSCFAHEQPDGAVWAALVRAVDALWPAEAAAAPPFMRIVTLESADERDRVLDRLRDVEGAVVHVGPSTRLDEHDLDTADYVAVWAVEERLQVTDPEGAVVPTGPCPECGALDAFDVTQPHDFRVCDDTVDGDTSTLPGGCLAVSARVLEVLRSIPTQGLVTRALLVGPEAAASTRWFQVLVERAVLTPCPEHTVIDGEPFCATCGTAHGTVVGAFRVPRPDVAGIDALARHPGLRTMLHVSRRVDDALRRAGIADLTRSDVIELCEHPG